MQHYMMPSINSKRLRRVALGERKKAHILCKVKKLSWMHQSIHKGPLFSPSTIYVVVGIWGYLFSKFLKKVCKHLTTKWYICNEGCKQKQVLCRWFVHPLCKSAGFSTDSNIKVSRSYKVFTDVSQPYFSKF